MIRLAMFSALAVIAITVMMIAVNPRTAGTSINLPQVETVGLSDHGLILIGPKDPTFDNLMAEKTSSVDISTAKPFSVFVVNKGAQSVAACLVKWEVLLPDGRTVTPSRAYNGALKTVSNGRSVHLTGDIVPNGKRLFSLIDSSDSSGRQVRMGGGGSDIIRQLSDSVKITVSIDGVLFVDGTFVGADTKNYFARLRAEMEASRDLYDEIAQLMNTSVEPKAAMDHIEALANSQLNSAQARSGKDSRSGKDFGYSIMKKRYATRLLGMRKAKGDRAVLEFVRAELSKPRVNLRKL